MDVMIRDKRTRLLPSKMIGSGGEAEVYDIGSGEVAKVFKLPTHVDFAQDRHARLASTERIREHQTKLLAWPKRLPKEAIGPTSLVRDVSGKNIVGYTMQYLSGMEVLLKYGERKYREAQGIGGDAIVHLFTNIHSLIRGIHATQTVIGDFNDLNVLVDSKMQAYLVDADSMQFGGFLSRVFTARFVDPLCCDLTASQASLIKPHDIDSDWYAYHVMLMQSLLFVGPYGGVHAPPDVSKKLKEWQRVQKRVTVFSPEVRYPKPALHYSILPDTILDRFHGVFERNERGDFPLSLLSGLHFTTCPHCQKVHARSSCPDCQPLTPSMVKEVITGSVEAMKVLDTTGRILYATVQDGIPRYVYHENGAYYREGHRKLLDGLVDPHIRLRIQGDTTVLARDGQVIMIQKDGNHHQLSADIFRGRMTVMDANIHAVYIISGGDFKRHTPSSMDYPDTLGTILPSQTLIWVSEKLGFTFAQAGGITLASVFQVSGKNHGASIELGSMKGRLIDATAVFSEDFVWFFVALQEGPHRTNRAYMIDQYGKLIGQADASADDGSWLGSIHGKCAVGRQLFSPTDDGIVRIEGYDGGLNVTKVFTDATRFVDSGSKLLFGRDGIYVVLSSRIWRLRMK
jgi:hypothetical protein